MRIAVFVIALAGTAYARPRYETLYELPGIDIVESINEYSHEKGDGGANIDDVHIYMTNKDGNPHVFRVKKLELLHGHCGSQKWQERTAITVKSLEAFAWDASEPSETSKDKVTVPAVKDMVSVRANFKAMRIYNECDRFAFAIQLEADGKLTPIELELLIKRNEPKK
jgi:hypothetical protein